MLINISQNYCEMGIYAWDSPWGRVGIYYSGLLLPSFSWEKELSG